MTPAKPRSHPSTSSGRTASKNKVQTVHAEPVEAHEPQKILVTGGAGFIGSHLVESLVAQGNQVTVLDDLSTGSLANLVPVKKQIKFIQADVANPQACETAAKNQKIIFHLAAQVSVAASTKNPTGCYQTNVCGTINMLEAARKHHAQRFLFSSSAAVYGQQTEPCSEKMVCRPTSAYGHSKLIGELLCARYWQQYGLQTVALRYFNVFGKRQRTAGCYAAVVAAFKECIKQNRPVVIFGDGTQTRDFVSVEKVVAANIRLANATGKNVAGNVYNIASGKSTSLLELIAMLKKEFPNYNIPPMFKPARSGDIPHSAADCTRYQQLIL